ncbi:MAG: TonB-dependent receptor [Lewinellaceae bacterium]|nr:TonB-dependent receptor [Saprospiraceae bacterium]MCB9340279.1 TonB-dependent receptor [Lewinellaceae bacterium]
MRYLILFLFPLLFLLTKSYAQQATDSIQITDLNPVTISAYRLEESDLQSPLAVSTIAAYRLRQGQQQLALDEALAAIPGVSVQNGDNFAQDLRVALRGFGARAAFGIRGIKILLDGIPETTPDGQGQVDNIDPGMLSSLEVVRGAASGLYGNASGGVISFNTLDFSGLQEKLEFGGSVGSNLFQKYTASERGVSKRGIYHHAALSFTQTNGYRDNSAMQSGVFNAGAMRPFRDSSGYVKLLFNFAHSPKAEDAGGLTLQEVEANRTSARDRNIQFAADEGLDQGRVGVVIEKRWQGKHRISTTTWLTLRDFENKLPFEAGGIVQLERLFFGEKLAYEFSHLLLGMPYRLTTGVDLEGQRDGRSRFDNLNGGKGEKSFDQTESFYNAGAYIIQQLSPAAKWRINLGLRYDGMLLKAYDHFLADGNDSGSREYWKFNPIFGASFSPSEAVNLYANTSTAFETPALSELSANPTGAGGFNPDLQPQQAVSFEIGAKGFIKKTRLRYDLALYHIRLKNETVPYELADFPGRTIYKNAASSIRNGLEVGLGSYLGRGFYSFLNYAYSAFEFEDYPVGAENLKGKMLPGIPRHAAYFELRYFKTKGLFGVAQAKWTGSQFADDVNSVKIDPFFTANIRLGFIKPFDRWEMEPSLGVNNVFNQRYFSNIRINAAAGRYYEPAAGVQFFGSLKVRI